MSRCIALKDSTNLLCDIGASARLLLSNRLPRSALTYVGEGRPPAAINAAGLPIPMVELDISPWLRHAVVEPRFRRLCVRFGNVNSGSLSFSVRYTKVLLNGSVVDVDSDSRRWEGA